MEIELGMLGGIVELEIIELGVSFGMPVTAKLCCAMKSWK